MNRRGFLQAALGIPAALPLSDRMAGSIRPRPEPKGLLTGLTAFDQATGGLYPGELTCVIGRPCSGKTALAIDLCVRAARLTGRSSVLFAADETAEQVMGAAGILLDRRRGLKTRAGFITVLPAYGEGMPFYVLDNAALVSPEFVSACTEALDQVEGGPCGFVAVDGYAVNRQAMGRDSRHCVSGAQLTSFRADTVAQGRMTMLLLRAPSPDDPSHPEFALRDIGPLAAGLDSEADQILILERPALYDPGYPVRRRNEAVLTVARRRRLPRPLGSPVMNFDAATKRFVDAEWDLEDFI